MATFESELDELAARLSCSLQLVQGGQPLDMKQMIYLANPNQLEFLRNRVIQEQHLCNFDDGEAVKKFLKVAKSKQNGDDGSSFYFSCFRNQIMMPTVVDAFNQMPADLRNDWMCIVCPEGVRVLVVAAYNTTRVYDMEGTWICEHDSHLPGGSPSKVSSVDDKDDCTILDCLYHDEQEVYYMLEVLCWKGTRYYKSESRDRLNATLEKIKGVPTLKQVSQSNPFRFFSLPVSYVCHKSAICSVISRANFSITGLLFYHKKALYIPGVTPLGIWIETGYIPPVLDIEVHKLEYDSYPESGTGLRRHWKKNRYEMSPEQSHTVHNSAYVTNFHARWMTQGNSGGMYGGCPPPWSMYPPSPASGYGYNMGFQQVQCLPHSTRQGYEQKAPPKKGKKEKKEEKKDKKTKDKPKTEKPGKDTTTVSGTDSSWADVSTDSVESDKPTEADDSAIQSEGTAYSDAVKSSDDSPKSDLVKSSDDSPKSDFVKSSDDSLLSDFVKSSGDSPKSDFVKSSGDSPMSDFVKSSNDSPNSDLVKSSDGSPKSDLAQSLDDSSMSDLAKSSGESPKSDASTPAKTTAQSDDDTSEETTEKTAPDRSPERSGKMPKPEAANKAQSGEA